MLNFQVLVSDEALRQTSYPRGGKSREAANQHRRELLFAR